MATEFTPNYNLAKVDFNVVPWHDELNANFDTIDAALFVLTGIGNIKGIWANDTAYVAGERVVDDTDTTLWQAEVSHTSAVAPATFADDRAANPTFWTQITDVVSFAGEWQTATVYSRDAYIYFDNQYGIVLNNYTSGASFAADVAAGDILILIDLQPSLAAAEASATAAALAETNAETAETNAETAATNAAASEAAVTTLYADFAGGAAGAALVKDTSADYDFSWQALPGGGDMLKSVYDPTNINASAFARANHTGTQTISTVTGLQAALDAAAAEIPAGTRMLFQQTAAPTGWTKETSATYNNKAIRLQTGTVTTGGSVSFTSVFTSHTPSGTNGNTTATGTVGGTALTEAQLPAHDHPATGLTFTGNALPGHSHTVGVVANDGGGNTAQEGDTTSSGSATTNSVSAGTPSGTIGGTTGDAGSGATHNHSFTGVAHSHTFTGNAINLAVQFVDFIIATRN